MANWAKWECYKFNHNHRLNTQPSKTKPITEARGCSIPLLEPRKAEYLIIEHVLKSIDV